MSDFTREAELSLTVNDAQIRRVRSQIEAGLEDIAVGVDASGVGGRGGQPRDPSTGQFMSIEGVEQRIVDQTAVVEDIRAYSEQLVDSVEARGDAGNGREDRRRRREFRWARERTEHLDDLVDLVGDMDGGGGGGGGGGLLGGLGTLAGTGVALTGAGFAGLGLGAGAGAAQAGAGAGEAFSEVGSAIADAIGDGEGLITFTPELNPVFDPEFSPVFEADFSPQFAPEFEFSPQINNDFDLRPSFNVSPEVRADLNANVNYSPSIRVNPTFNLELTGLDLGRGGGGGLIDDIERTIDDIRRELRGDVDDLERRIESATSGGPGGR